MPKIELVLFMDEVGGVPLLIWLNKLHKDVRIKAAEKVDLLVQHGNELRRPLTDYLAEGIRELRFAHMNVNYRILYFFEGRGRAVISHGCTKKRVVPRKEIERAIKNRNEFRSDPKRHTYRMDEE